MSSTAKLSSKFKISIPKAGREENRWKAGQEFVFIPKGRGVLVMPVPEFNHLAGIAKGANKENYRECKDRDVRFCVPENYIGNRMPSLLARFSRMFPSTVDNYLTLREQINADALDLAVILLLENNSEAQLLRQTQFVWAAADTLFC